MSWTQLIFFTLFFGGLLVMIGTELSKIAGLLTEIRDRLNERD